MFGGMAPWAQPGYAMWKKISCFHEGGSSVLSLIRIRSAVLMHESMGIQTRQTSYGYLCSRTCMRRLSKEGRKNRKSNNEKGGE